VLADLELLGDFVVKHQGRPPPVVLREAAVELSPTATSRWWSTQTVIRVGCFRSIATSSRRRDRRACDRCAPGATTRVRLAAMFALRMATCFEAHERE